MYRQLASFGGFFATDSGGPCWPNCEMYVFNASVLASRYVILNRKLSPFVSAVGAQITLNVTDTAYHRHIKRTWIRAASALFNP